MNKENKFTTEEIKKLKEIIAKRLNVLFKEKYRDLIINFITVTTNINYEYLNDYLKIINKEEDKNETWYSSRNIQDLDEPIEKKSLENTKVWAEKDLFRLFTDKYHFNYINRDCSANLCKVRKDIYTVEVVFYFDYYGMFPEVFSLLNMTVSKEQGKEYDKAVCSCVINIPLVKKLNPTDSDWDEFDRLLFIITTEDESKLSQIAGNYELLKELVEDIKRSK